MKKVVALLSLIAVLGCLSEPAEATQKKRKPNTPAQSKQKIDPYELCKLLVAKDGGPVPRVQRYRITKDGMLHCWYLV